LKYDQKEIFEVEEESGFPKEKGKFYTLEELLTHMICYSDNAATLVLMQFLGDSSILKVYNDLNIQIRNDFNQNTDFISVKEYAAILRVLYHATYLNEAMSEKALTLLTQSKYTKGIRQAIPANLVIAHKYGNRIDESKGNKKSELHHFGIVYEKNRPFIIGVMTKGGTLEEREKIVSDLAKITYEQVKAEENKTENTISVFKE
jgi:beta-lactamase class A